MKSAIEKTLYSAYMIMYYAYSALKHMVLFVSSAVHFDSSYEEKEGLCRICRRPLAGISQKSLYTYCNRCGIGSHVDNGRKL